MSRRCLKKAVDRGSPVTAAMRLPISEDKALDMVVQGSHEGLLQWHDPIHVKLKKLGIMNCLTSSSNIQPVIAEFKECCADQDAACLYHALAAHDTTWRRFTARSTPRSHYACTALTALSARPSRSHCYQTTPSLRVCDAHRVSTARLPRSYCDCITLWSRVRCAGYDHVDYRRQRSFMLFSCQRSCYAMNIQSGLTLKFPHCFLQIL